MRRLFIALFSLSLFVPLSAAARSWPTDRGDNRRSGATDEKLAAPLVLHWTYKAASSPRPAWPAPAEELPRAHCDNAFHVIAAEGVAYFGSSVDDRVYAVEVADGKIVWTFAAEGPVRFAPTYSDGPSTGSGQAKVFFGSDDGFVYCLKAADGKLLWKYRPGPNGQKVLGNGRMISAWPIRTSVLVEDGKVFATAGVFPFEGIFVCALKADDGSVIWKNDAAGAGRHELEFGGISPHGYLVASPNMLYVPSGRAMPAAFDRRTGRLCFYASPAGKRGGAWALLDDDRLIAGLDASGRPEKRAYDAATGQLQGDPFTWAPGGIDMVVAPGVSHVLTVEGIQTIDRRRYDEAGKTMRDAQAGMEKTQILLTAAMKAVKGPQSLPAPDVPASSLKPIKATSGWGEATMNKSVEGKALRMAGKEYATGIGVHSVSELVYPLKDEYKAFVAVVGIDEEVGSRGTAVFRVEFDGRSAYETPVLHGGGGSWNLCVAVPPGSKQIRLVAGDGGDGFAYDHADWAAAGFLRNLPPALPAAAQAPRAVADQLARLRAERDRLAGELKKAQDVRAVRTFARKGLDCIIQAGDVVFAGGDGAVLAVDPNAGKELWSAPVQGRAVALAASGGRLFVSTDEGGVYCFGSPKRPVAPGRMVAPDGVDGPKPRENTGERDAGPDARSIVDATGIMKGYCLVSQSADVGLALELAKRTELNVIILEGEPRRLAAARRKLAAVALPAERISVEPWDIADLPDYFANLIVAEDARAHAGDFPGPLGRLLRPFGGTAVRLIGHGDNAGLQKVVRGKLDGAGSWTAQYGNPRNTACSDDRLIQGPFGVLWFGLPGPRDIPERHARAASGVAMNGRLFVQGKGYVAAYDAYNGTFLWKTEIPGAIRIRADVDGGNLALTDDALYVAVEDKCCRLSPATGKIERTYALPPSDDQQPRRWGYVSIVGNVLLGSASRPLARKYPQWQKQPSPGGALTAALIRGDELFAVDPADGRLLWTYLGKDIADISIAADGRAAYLVEAASDEQRKEAAADKQRLTEQSLYEPCTDSVAPGDVDIRVAVALDLAGGKVLWKKPIDVTGCGGDKMGSAVQDGVLLLFGHFSNHDTALFKEGRLTWRRIAALDARDGRVIWSRPLNYLRRPVVIGDTIIIEPRACELRTGRIVTRSHPLSGQAVPWEFLRPGHSCGITSASQDTLFFRSFCAAMVQRTGDGGLDLFGAIRPGCWINIIPANGLMLMPEASSGCTCSYPIRCSVALVRRPSRVAHDETVFITHGPNTPVRRLAVNLGAAGDVRDASGALWLAYPRPHAVSGVGYGPYGLDLKLDCTIADGGGFFYRDFRPANLSVPGPADADARPWLFSSGCRGLRRCELPLIDDLYGEPPGRYVVRLGLTAPKGEGGRRVADVKLQGRCVLEGLVVTNGPVVKQFDGIDVKTNLVIELVPRPAGGDLPVVHFIEVVREDHPPAPAPPAHLSRDEADKRLARAAGDLQAGNVDKALAGYHAVFAGAEGIEPRLAALEAMTALGRVESLACIRSCWDGAAWPILADYRPPDMRLVRGMIQLRLAVADRLATADKPRAARAVAAGEALLPLLKLEDQPLKGRLLKAMGYVLDWQLVGPIPWEAGQGSIQQVLDASKPLTPSGPCRIDGTSLEWSRHLAGEKRVDLTAAIGAGHRAAAYAYAEIPLDEARELVLDVEADNAMACWFNGRAVGAGEKSPRQPLAVGAIKVQGRKGKNTVVLKVVVDRGWWSFSLKALDAHGVPAEWYAPAR